MDVNYILQLADWRAEGGYFRWREGLCWRGSTTFPKIPNGGASRSAYERVSGES